MAQEKGFKHLLLGGWQISDVTTIQGGFPVDTSLGTGTPGLATRPKPYRGSKRLRSEDGGRMVQYQRVCCPCPRILRECLPGSITGPGTISFDMAFYKDFNIGERQKFQFRSEFFNIFNHTKLCERCNFFRDPETLDR